MKKSVIKAFCAAALLTAIVSVSGCSSAETGSAAYSDPETSSVQSEETNEASEIPKSEGSVSTITLSDEQTEKLTNGIDCFSSKFFKGSRKTVKQDRKDNVIVSPLSAYTALAMLSNGAKGVTDSEIRTILSVDNASDEQIPEREELNAYIKGYMDNLDNDDAVLSMANSFWLMKRDDIHLNENYPKTIDEYYHAEMFNEPVSENTVKKINEWVADKTHQMIPSILTSDSLTEDTVSILLNAVAFEGSWMEPYEESDVSDGTFTNIDGSSSKADFMNSTEGRYISDDFSTGFIKSYVPSEEYGYFFMAILPNEDVGIDEYIDEKLSYDTFEKLYNSSVSGDVHASLPKFSFDTYVNLNQTLSDMGMHSAFSAGNADFSEMAVSDKGNICVDKVVQKAHVEVDEKGTRAAAVTAITTEDNAIAAEPEVYEVILDRPFIFAIYDYRNNIPVFIGTVENLDKLSQEN